MKRLSLVFMIVGLLCYNVSAFAELTVEDLEKIREIVNESEARLEKRITERIAEVEKRLSGDIQAIEERFSGDIQTVGERLTFHGSLIIALIIAIIGFVSVPMGFITFQYFKIRSQQEEEIKALREKIEALETQLLVENRS